MGAVVAPLMIAGSVQALGVLPPALSALMEDQALSDTALRERIGWALDALRK